MVDFNTRNILEFTLRNNNNKRFNIPCQLPVPQVIEKGTKRSKMKK